MATKKKTSDSKLLARAIILKALIDKMKHDYTIDLYDNEIVVKQKYTGQTIILFPLVKKLTEHLEED